jgi:hypothetical protein
MDLNVKLPGTSKGNTMNTHKRRNAQSHENSQHSSNEALPCGEVIIPPSKLKASSLEPSLTSAHLDILSRNGLLYWNSTEVV